MILKLRIANEKHLTEIDWYDHYHMVAYLVPFFMWFLFYNCFSALRPKLSPFRIPNKFHFHAKLVVSPFMLCQDCSYLLIMTSTEETDIEIKISVYKYLGMFLCWTTVIRVGFFINLWQATTMFHNYWDKWALIIIWLILFYFFWLRWTFLFLTSWP